MLLSQLTLPDGSRAVAMREDAQTEARIVPGTTSTYELALAAYKAHPIYDETTRKVRPMRELRYSADFRSTLG